MSTLKLIQKEFWTSLRVILYPLAPLFPADEVAATVQQDEEFNTQLPIWHRQQKQPNPYQTWEN
jgi:hypothetical protein